MTIIATTPAERYIQVIKRRVGQFKKGKESPQTQIKSVEDRIRCLIAESARKLLGLSSKVKIETQGIATQRSHITVNGVGVVLCADVDLVNEEIKQLKASLAELTGARSENCKELELLNEAVSSAGINKFKAYTRARFDKLDAISEFSDKDFSQVVAEFLETQRGYTCKL